MKSGTRCLVHPMERLNTGLCILSFAEFNDINFSGLTILVCGIIGNVDPFLMIPVQSVIRKLIH